MADDYASRVAGMASQTGAIFPFRYRPGPPETTTGTDESGRSMTFQSPRYEFAIPGMVSDSWQSIKDMLQIPGQTYAGEISQAAMPEAALRVAGGIMTGSTMGARPMGSLGVGGLPGSRLAEKEVERRLARAREMGFTVDAYKGMNPYHPDSLPATDWKGRIVRGADRIPQELTSIAPPGREHAGFFSSDPEVASRFAEVLTRQGAVYPVKLKFDNPLVIDAGGKHAAAFQFPSVAREQNAVDDYNAFQSAFKNGHDGIILKNTKDEGTIYVPKDANQIRSRFAKFDPRKASSTDLLAAVPLGIGAAAAMTANDATTHPQGYADRIGSQSRARER